MLNVLAALMQVIVDAFGFRRIAHRPLAADEPHPTLNERHRLFVPFVGPKHIDGKQTHLDRNNNAFDQVAGDDLIVVFGRLYNIDLLQDADAECCRVSSADEVTFCLH